ncbi:MAG: M23 family metallopeptidase [Rhodospirillaceae bacterium]|nr:M23 family metallopeptidase [Rhodospirillaceae bacterium]
MALLLGLAAALAPTAAQAQAPLTLKGKLTQGALVIGRTLPGATVTLDGKPVVVDATGAFALGFDRDAKASWSLAITAPGGASLTRQLAVAPRHYNIQRLTGIAQRYVEPPPEMMQRLEREYFLVRKAREAMSDQPFWRTGFIWPAMGRISGVYGSQRIINGKPLRPHYGVDIAAPAGTPIRAAAAGIVTLAEDDLYFSGRTVIIDHGLGVSTLYIHMSAKQVHVGSRVLQGQVIGAIGTTGRSTGPHLHWGLNWHQDYLDPATVVGPMPGSVKKKKG